VGNFFRLVATLTGIALVASLGLSAVYNATYEITEEYKRQEQESARIEVLPCVGGEFFEQTVTDSIVDGRQFAYYTSYTAEESDEIRGYTFTAYGKGYSSTIETIVGVDPTGTICGVKITSQKETPGLGAKVEEVSSENMLWDVMSGRAKDESDVKPWFQVQFQGRALDELRVVKSRDESGIVAITGATISSEAVTGSVRSGLTALLAIVGIGEPAEEGQRDAGDGSGSDETGDKEAGATSAEAEEPVAPTGEGAARTEEEAGSEGGR
jgi:electron transport complex protein RnfG